jgi:hypothetical protein
MKIAIDISQIVYEGTGVARFVRGMVKSLISAKSKNHFILFGGSLRQKEKIKQFADQMKKINPNVRSVILPLPPKILDFIWNKLHIISPEYFTGPVDIFWSSDWTQPPLMKARGVTTIHDVSFLLYPKEHDKNITATQKRRLAWVKKECQSVFCDSEATRHDVINMLGIGEKKLHVVYPGIS